MAGSLRMSGYIRLQGLYLMVALMLGPWILVTVATRHPLTAKVATQLPAFKAEWQHYRDHLCTIHLGGLPLCGFMGPIVDYPFNLSLAQLERSRGYAGDGSRIHR